MEESFLKRIEEQPAFTADSLVDKIYHFLEDSIIRKDITPGSKLKEETIANLLGVSRSPVREALIRLEASGLVIHQAGHGRIAASFMKQDILDNYEAWAMIESYAGGLACLAAQEGDHLTIEEILKQMRISARSDNNVNRYRQLNHRFHSTLVTPCPNKMLVRMYENALKPIEWCWNISMIWHHNTSFSESEHEKIFFAYRKRDRVAFESLVRRHIGEAAKRFESEYVKRNPQEI